MKKSILVGIIFVLVGCSNNVEKIVKEQLRDPSSAEFKDVKDQCGFVNAKNGLGGYSGFKRFIVINDTAIIESDLDKDILPFTLSWAAYCSKNESNNSDRAKCIENAETSAAALNAKQRGVTIQEAKQAIRSVDDNKDSIRVGDKLIEDAYKTNFKSADMYALEVLNQCLKH